LDTGDDEGDDGDEAHDIEEPEHEILDEGGDGNLGETDVRTARYIQPLGSR
jgi:hypothetical protein